MLLVQKLCSTATIINHTPREIRIFEERKTRYLSKKIEIVLVIQFNVFKQTIQTSH